MHIANKMPFWLGVAFAVLAALFGCVTQLHSGLGFFFRLGGFVLFLCGVVSFAAGFARTWEGDYAMSTLFGLVAVFMGMIALVEPIHPGPTLRIEISAIAFVFGLLALSMVISSIQRRTAA